MECTEDLTSVRFRHSSRCRFGQSGSESKYCSVLLSGNSCSVPSGFQTGMGFERPVDRLYLRAMPQCILEYLVCSEVSPRQTIAIIISCRMINVSHASQGQLASPSEKSPRTSRCNRVIPSRETSHRCRTIVANKRLTTCTKVCSKTTMIAQRASCHAPTASLR